MMFVIWNQPSKSCIRWSHTTLWWSKIHQHKIVVKLITNCWQSCNPHYQLTHQTFTNIIPTTPQVQCKEQISLAATSTPKSAPWAPSGSGRKVSPELLDGCPLMLRAMRFIDLRCFCCEEIWDSEYSQRFMAAKMQVFRKWVRWKLLEEK